MNLKDLQTFLGMVQYLNKFSPRIAEIAEPLQDLMKKHAPYEWGPEHNHLFDSIKKEIVQASILRYYDAKKETILQTDAECKYVTIELEALAVPWAIEKFHHVLYASHFTLETNQKPLETILAMSLTEGTPQLQ